MRDRLGLRGIEPRLFLQPRFDRLAICRFERQPQQWCQVDAVHMPHPERLIGGDHDFGFDDPAILHDRALGDVG